MITPAPWWQNAVIYQIYPKSFQDSTGNGTGDLPGITQRLDYLQRLGVDALWMTPVFVSPQIDNGYDVADYCAIDPAYGTLEDFDRLVAAAHQRGIRVIIDMVFNHTSTRHPWFHASLDPDSHWRQWYIWRNGRAGGPPNNWLSKFGGSAWSQAGIGGHYYLHLFAAEQADLNWEHPPVRQALGRICHFWADRGIDGMRLDVLNLVSKPSDLPDAPLGDGRCFYTDGPRVHEYIRQMNREVFQPRGLMTIGEMSSTTMEKSLANASLGGDTLSMIAHFHHLKIDYPAGEKWSLGKPDFIKLKQIFAGWQQGFHGRAWQALFWCNHDQPRILSRFGDPGTYRVASAKMLAMALHGMQGTPIIYQGEELGMTDPGFTDLDQYRDVESLNMFGAFHAHGVDPAQLLTILARRSRDNGRTPMQWDDSPQAGFTTGIPWIGLCGNHQRINAAGAIADKDSVFHCYRQLIQLRKTLPVLVHGDYQDLCPAHPWIWCYQRSWRGERLLVVVNLSSETQSWHPPAADSGRWRRVISNYDDAPATPAPLILRSWEAIWWHLGQTAAGS